jgi:inward rectifier potassium channel
MNGRTQSERIVRRGLKARPLGDLYHFLMTTSWSRLFLTIVLAYLAANLGFAVLYWLDREGVEHLDTFGDAFFFSVQTMSTIGYGRLVPTSNFANAIVTVEAAFGLISMAMATGLMFAKFSRPTARVLFSKYAIIGKRDGQQTLMVRLGNERRSGLVEAQLRLVFLRDERTAEGERMRRFHPLKLVRDSTAMFALSWTVMHVIDEQSPLHGETDESLRASGAELIASLIGLDDVTRDTMHARYTWVADDILWDKRFADVILIEPGKPRVLDFSRFHDVEDAQK